MLRARGGRSLTTSPPISIVPDGDLLEPGDHPQVVDLPQPDGPTSATNSPSAIVEIDARTTSTAP